jgi:hypothetical protein
MAMHPIENTALTFREQFPYNEEMMKATPLQTKPAVKLKRFHQKIQDNKERHLTSENRGETGAQKAENRTPHRL